MEEDKVNAKQARAVELVVKGMTDGEVAKKIGVSRQIVNTWRNHDAGFMYLVETRRQAIEEAHQDKLNSLIEKSLEIVGKALETGDEETKLKMAMYVLRMAGLRSGSGGNRQANRKESEKRLVERSLFEVVSEMGWVELE